MLIISIDSRPYLVFKTEDDGKFILSLDALIQSIKKDGHGTISGALDAINKNNTSLYSVNKPYSIAFYKQEKESLIIHRPGLAVLSLPATKISGLDEEQTSRFTFMPDDHGLFETGEDGLHVITHDIYPYDQYPVLLAWFSKDEVIFKVRDDKEDLKYRLSVNGDGKFTVGVVQ